MSASNKGVALRHDKTHPELHLRIAHQALDRRHDAVIAYTIFIEDIVLFLVLCQWTLYDFVSFKASSTR